MAYRHRAAPHRADRWRHGLLTLLWLVGVQDETVAADEAEPSPPLTALSPALSALADFLDIDRDLIEAATGARAARPESALTPGEVESLLREIAENEKVALLRRVFADEALVGAELRRRYRIARLAPTREALLRAPHHTAGAVARRVAMERERRTEESAAAERRKMEREAAEAQARRVTALARRGEQAWHDMATFIEMRNAKGYEQATLLLSDLGGLADRDDTFAEFAGRMAELRIRHASKSKFIERLDTAGLPDGPRLAAGR